MRNAFCLIGLFIGLIGYWFLGDSFPERFGTAIGVIVITIPSCIVGWLVALALRNRIDADSDAADIIAWTSLVWWIFPPLGIVTSSLVWSWSKLTERREARFLILSAVCALASMVNMAIGAHAKVKEPLDARAAAVAYGSP